MWQINTEVTRSLWVCPKFLSVFYSENDCPVMGSSSRSTETAVRSWGERCLFVSPLFKLFNLLGKTPWWREEGKGQVKLSCRKASSLRKEKTPIFMVWCVRLMLSHLTPSLGEIIVKLPTRQPSTACTAHTLTLLLHQMMDVRTANISIVKEQHYSRNKIFFFVLQYS